MKDQMGAVCKGLAKEYKLMHISKEDEELGLSKSRPNIENPSNEEYDVAELHQVIKVAVTGARFEKYRGALIEDFPESKDKKVNQRQHDEFSNWPLADETPTAWVSLVSFDLVESE